MNEKQWWTIFTFVRDGISGSELLGMVLVLSLIALLVIVQLKDTGPDFGWLFLDAQTGKVSRTGFMTFGGFLLGCWCVVDAEQSGHLDWAFFGTFLTYCAGLRAIEAWKPPQPPGTMTSQTTTRESSTTSMAPPAG